MQDFLKVVVFGGLFIIPFLPVYVENSFFFPFITGKNFTFRIIIEIIFAAWILLSLYDVRYRPKFSWILAGFTSLLAVMFFANLLGEYPLKSFFSNFERMDGYITLVHVGLYLIVAGSVLTTEKLWSYFFHTSLFVAISVALYGLAQHADIIEGGRNRVDSRLGNAAYMAVYMLFHIFIAAYLFVRTKVTLYRVVYALLAVIMVYTLLLTGTRGTFLGFIAGSLSSVVYIALFARRLPQLRKAAMVSFVGLAILVGSFVMLRDSAFIQDSGPLKRIANINLQEDLEHRSTIWGMALEGVAERPLLGWGQGNFNYVFNYNYEPSLYAQESWFDRVHNIFLDWLIAGGVLGLAAYLSIFVAAFYYLFWQPFRSRDNENNFDVLERAVLIGLLVGYLTHNLVVFDNIISYIFFGSILALIHSRVGSPIASLQSWKIDSRIIGQFATPLIIIIAGAIIYFANAPGLGAAGDIISAIRQDTIEKRLIEYDKALARDSFAQQEIVEQMTQNAMSIANNPNIPPEQKQAFIQRTELEMLRLIEMKPNDARMHTFFSSFYRAIGALPQAEEQAAIARELSPQKQAIIIEQAIIALQQGKTESAQAFLKEAWDLDTSYSQPQVLYAATLIATGDIEEARSVVGTEHFTALALNDYALSSAEQSGDESLLIEMFQARVEARPNVAQNHASLSFLYYQAGEIEAAVSALETASVAVPAFAPTASCFIDNINAGNEPNQDC